MKGVIYMSVEVAVKNSESIENYREEHLKIAKELFYDNKCFEEIRSANRIEDIDRAMINARKRL